jgi:hypothetical protein
MGLDLILENMALVIFFLIFLPFYVILISIAMYVGKIIAIRWTFSEKNKK